VTAQAPRQTWPAERGVGERVSSPAALAKTSADASSRVSSAASSAAIVSGPGAGDSSRASSSAASALVPSISGSDSSPMDRFRSQEAAQAAEAKGIGITF